MKWRINFSIRDSNFNLVGYAARAFIQYIPKKNGQQLFREWYLEYENGSCTAYIPVDVIEPVAEFIKNKVIAEPEWADKMHQETEKLNWDYFNYAKGLSIKNLSVLDNTKLLEYFKTLRQHQLISHCYAISTTWFLDSDREVFSNYLKDRLFAHLEKAGITDLVKKIEYFTLLTSPTKGNFAQEEQLEFLELVKLIKNSGRDTDIFKTENLDVIFDNLSENIKNAIEKYYKKWRWTPYGYIGPAYEMDYYIKQIKDAVAQIENVDGVMQEEKNRHNILKKEQEEFVARVNLPADLQHTFAIARDIIWLKDFRKYCIWHGHYVLDMLTKEIAKRLNITHKQANNFLTEEVENALLKGQFDENVLNARIKYCVMWANEDELKCYYGNEAKKIIENLDVEEVVVDEKEGFKGTTACPGEASGAVKIVLSVEDIGKVKEGDIMLALTTYPAMLPAMKKAAAIVTEDGGITCHAAIVARELRIPCVVGAKKVTKLLKDGDKVMVDATMGIVKRI